LVAKFIVAPLALDDIDDLTDCTRETDPTSDFDLRFIDSVYEAFEFPADDPGVGQKRADLTNQTVCRRSAPAIPTYGHVAIR
jgi:plasmid stabilization system protein ParE